MITKTCIIGHIKTREDIMTLEIKRTPDSVKLTDTDVRDAIVDYVERNAHRLILNPHSDGIRYHATDKGRAGPGVDYDTVYVTVQLQDPAPTPYAHAAAERDRRVRTAR